MPRRNPSPRVIFSLILALYAVIVFVQSQLKLVWADELITFYIARQPGVDGVWQALRAGADPNPPLTHLLVKLSTSLFGVSGWAMRVPGELCVLLALVSMWSILRRWVDPVFAAAGLLAFMATRGFDYAYDARSYAPMLGFTLAALALYLSLDQQAGPRRFLTLAAMAITLAAAISSNYYCVLAFFSIAAAEITRAVGRRARPSVWLALTIAGLPLLAYFPLIRQNIAEFAPNAWNRPQLSMISTSYFVLVEGIFWPVLAMALYALFFRSRSVPSARERLQKPEQAALITLLLYPILGYVIAVAGAGMISPRCAVPVCCGFGLAFGVLAQRIFGQKPRVAFAVVGVLALWVVVRQSVCADLLLQQRRAFFTLRDQVAQTTGPILAADSSFELPLYFYSGPAVQRRMVVPIDFAAIHRYEKDDSGEQNLWAGRDRVFPFTIVAFSEVSVGSGATIIASPDGWLAHLLRAGGVELKPADVPISGWVQSGGVFSPMAHPETRILVVAPTRVP